MNRLRRGKRKARQGGRRVRIGAPDGSLTGLAGLAAVDALIDRLGLVSELDSGIGPIKVRDRGSSGGQRVAGIATGQLAGADCLTGLDRVRADVAASLLVATPVPASRTAGRLAAAFGPGRLAGIETGLAAIYRRWLALVRAQVRAPLVLRDPTLDLDASDIEVFGHTKQGIGWNYAGTRCGRCTWRPGRRRASAGGGPDRRQRRCPPRRAGPVGPGAGRAPFAGLRPAAGSAPTPATST